MPKHNSLENSTNSAGIPKPVTLGPSLSKSDIEDILRDRGSKYGEFSKHAEITQRLKFDMFETPNWPLLSNSQRECLEMVAHKLGRILNGDPNYVDSWTDIIGYVRLVEKELIKE